MSDGTDEDLLTTKEAARVLKIGPGTLANYRVSGGGPPFYKLGHGRRAPVRYRRRDLHQWLDDHQRISTTNQGAEQ